MGIYEKNLISEKRFFDKMDAVSLKKGLEKIKKVVRSAKTEQHIITAINMYKNFDNELMNRWNDGDKELSQLYKAYIDAIERVEHTSNTTLKKARKKLNMAEWSKTINRVALG